MLVKLLNRHKEENDFNEFYSKLSSFAPNLKKFMTRSLKAAEAQSSIDRGFYDAEGMLDEIYLEVYKDLSTYTDEDKLRTIMFAKAVQKIEEKKILEQENPDYLSTETLLKQELNRLDESFTTQADGDLILNTELDDISYKQEKEYSQKVILDESIEIELIKKLKMQDELLPSFEHRALFGTLYSNIPLRSKSVLELFAFGNQSTHDISEILEVPENVIDHILDKLKERFKLL